VTWNTNINVGHFEARIGVGHFLQQFLLGDVSEGNFDGDVVGVYPIANGALPLVLHEGFELLEGSEGGHFVC